MSTIIDAKRAWVLWGALLVGCGAPMPRAAPPRFFVQAEEGMIPKGTLLVARLNQEIGTRLSRAGQLYSATVVTPIVDEAGRTIVPRGAELRGRIVALLRGHNEEPARVELALDRIRIGELEQAIEARVISADVEPRGGEHEASEEGNEFGGAIFGALTSGLSGAISGAVISSRDARASSTLWRRTDARLPMGALMTVRIEVSIPLERSSAALIRSERAQPALHSQVASRHGIDAAELRVRRPEIGGDGSK